jgi:hypothetical protein
MMQWDYIRVQIDIHKIASADDQVASLGREGWELVSAVNAADAYLHLWFKRPRGGGGT